MGVTPIALVNGGLLLLTEDIVAARHYNPHLETRNTADKGESPKAKPTPRNQLPQHIQTRKFLRTGRDRRHTRSSSEIRPRGNREKKTRG
jgi:hypothetical protein